MGNSLTNRASSPDANAGGLLQGPLDPLRYEVPRPLDRDEVPGIMAGMIPAGSRFLDVGGGEGTLGEALSRACRAEVAAIDPDAARAAPARARGLTGAVDYFGHRAVPGVGPLHV